MKLDYIDDFEAWKADFLFYTPVTVRFSETDMFGNMNNVSTFIYFEQARIEFLKAVGLFDLENNQKTALIVADLHCDYLAQAFFDEDLKIYVKAGQVGNSSVDIHYMAEKEDGLVCFTGRGRLVKINIQTGKPIKFTDDEKEKLTSK